MCRFNDVAVTTPPLTKYRWRGTARHPWRRISRHPPLLLLLLLLLIRRIRNLDAPRGLVFVGRGWIPITGGLLLSRVFIARIRFFAGRGGERDHRAVLRRTPPRCITGPGGPLPDGFAVLPNRRRPIIFVRYRHVFFFVIEQQRVDIVDDVFRHELFFIEYEIRFQAFFELDARPRFSGSESLHVGVLQQSFRTICL